MGSQSSTASWWNLRALRKRGQRPAGNVYVTDHGVQRRNLEASGLYALPVPQADQAIAVAGLDVVLIADRNECTVEVAQVLAAKAGHFATYFRGEGLAWVT